MKQRQPSGRSGRSLGAQEEGRWSTIQGGESASMLEQTAASLSHRYDFQPLIACRPFDSVVKLLSEKASCLARPDAIASSVGTRIHTFQNGTWIEDLAWSGSLDKDWDVEIVLQAVRQAVEEVRFLLLRGRWHSCIVS